MLADVFENFRNMCIKVYKLDPAHSLSAAGLAWQACLKKTEVKLELLTDVAMLLMTEKGRRGVYIYYIQYIDMQKQIINILRIIINIKKNHFFNI